MRCVDYNLRPAPTPGGWHDYSQRNFVCHKCEKLLKGVSDQLYFFPDMDFLFHQHGDNTYWRALDILENGDIRISQIDSEEENVLQRYAITLDNTGGFRMVGTSQDLRTQSKRFFESMRRQNRSIVPDDPNLRFL